MRKFSYALVKEYLELLWVNLKVGWKDFIEYGRVFFHYYLQSSSFAKVDAAVVFSYLFKNPFAMSKRFLLKKGENNIYVYGETPLTSMEIIAKECRLSKEDVVFEAGSGRGRVCFWLNAFIGCRVVGIEIIPEFVERAKNIASTYHVNGVEFRQEDMFEADYAGATAIYLYGTCLDESSIEKLIERFSLLPSGTKIMTVSYPLSDYTDKPLFEVMKRFPAAFNWGNGDIYLQVKR